MSDRRSIFITGAAAGIGRATARKFATKGWFVGLYDIDGAGLAQLRDEFDAVFGPGSCVTGELDVTDAEAFKDSVAAFLLRSGGRFDMLFNNAGILKMGAFDQVDVVHQHRTVDINIKGIINGVDAALPALKDTAREYGEARIVSMASASAIYGIPELTVYSASKHAVRAMTEGFSMEFEPYGIQVSDVLPSYVDTGMVRNQETPTGDFQQTGPLHTAEDIAALVWKAAHGEEVHVFPNAQFRLMDKLARIIPGFIRRRIKDSLQH